MILRIEKRKFWNTLLIIKYIFSIFITYLVFATIENWRYMLVSLAELLVMLCVSHMVYSYNRTAGHIVHFCLLLLYNVQTAVMHFGGSFVSLIMLTNIGMFNDLQGKFDEYICLAIPVIICMLIPMKCLITNRKKLAVGLVSCTAIWIVALFVCGTNYSPVGGLFNLYSEWKEYKDINEKMASVESGADEFYHDSIEQYIDKPETLPENPNVVLIFMEGISQSLIYDERDFMPNLREFRAESLTFENYYNHTFATFRGIIGQLYSGYQHNDMDINVLPSIQNIFGKMGYSTTFINTEPTNGTFTEYLSSLEFSNLVNREDLVKEGEIYIHDKDAFELLYQIIEEQHEEEMPFFTAIYTFGTHVSLDSPNEKYGEGASATLNKYYNADAQFGEFLRKFKESALYEDTILIVTSDHATYVDEDYLNTFPNESRECSALDEILLCMYHKDIVPQELDANGRNTLDLAPTILDYLDISSENYFLGQSLFADDENIYNTIFHYPSGVRITKGDTIKELEEIQYNEFMDMYIKYATIKGSSYTEISRAYMTAVVSDDCSTMTILLEGAMDYESIWFAVWSEKNEQDDLEWYNGNLNSNGEWNCVVDLSKHGDMERYHIHAYGNSTNAKDMILGINVAVPNYPPFHTEVEIADDCSSMTITTENGGSADGIIYAVWSEENGQDDLNWYPATKNADGIWYCVINLLNHDSKGIYAIHTYTGQEMPEEKVSETSAIVLDYPPLHVESEVSEDSSIITFMFTLTDETYQEVLFPVWSENQGQDDLVWYQPEKNEDGSWSCTVNVEEHCMVSQDKIILHVYGKKENQEELEYLTSEMVVVSLPSE